ncbi:hypothetical protein NUW54_g2001 [Trametes sanguinea]|uniref:Uncharacterized protein n=1 Tax=Trametes sanguinea TaxID=158606 RepID=A0ACC1Q4S8_9APHY|nr:hypothetical protein NUW54_g2001 [Trametes sanguinea]
MLLNPKYLSVPDQLLLDFRFQSLLDSTRLPHATRLLNRLISASYRLTSHLIQRAYPRALSSQVDHSIHDSQQSLSHPHLSLHNHTLYVAMAASNVVFGSLSVALAQAITYITRPLIARYSAVTIIKLQLALEANLTAQFTPSWVPTEPLRGSGRRCLTLSPFGVPPRPVYNACKSAGVEWTEWIALLGNFEFDLFIDPGCVSIRIGAAGAGKKDEGEGRKYPKWLKLGPGAK